MSAVDNITETLAATSIAPLAPTGANNVTGGDPINASENEAVIASAVEGRRLYIGNLAYATTEGDLREFFTGFAIETTSIPTNPRTTRPVGYAFVDLSSADDAQRAIGELSGKEVLDRKVSVQLARKPETAAERAEAHASGGEGISGGEGGKRRNSGRGRGYGRGRGRGGRTSRGGRSRQNNADGPTNAPEHSAPLNDITNENATVEPGREASADAGHEETADRVNNAEGEHNKDNHSKPRGPRVQKQRGPPEDGIPSKTKVMVANLPYDLSEDKLKELFGSYEPTAAKIALRPIPRFMVKKLQARNEPRKGRGFGFVTCGSEELQQRAVEEMNGKEVSGREIAVKIAIDSPGKEDVDHEGAGQEAGQEVGQPNGASVNDAIANEA